MTTPFFPVGQKDDEKDDESDDLIATTHPRATLPDLSVESSEIKDEVGINDPISPAQSPEDLKTPVENDDSKEKEAIEISDEDEEDEDGPTAEDEYRVEKILNHRIVVKENGEKGFQFFIKWLGFNKSSDNTWEDEENCQGSQKLVDEYWENMGGKPVIRSSKRKSDGDGSAKKRQRGDQPAVTSTSKSEVDNWDDAVEKVVTMEKTETGLILVYLDWKNGYKSCHDSTTVYEKCPQQMLKFYENNLIFKLKSVEEKPVDES